MKTPLLFMNKIDTLQFQIKKMTREKIHQIIFILAGLFTIIGAVTQFAKLEYAPYIFALGSLLLIYSHLKNIFSTSENDFRTRRLSRIGFISSLMLIISNYFMFTSSNAWVVFLLIYAVVTFSLSFRSE